MQPIADANHVKEADCFGVVSANFVADKFEKSGLTATKSKLVDAPIINEFPICMECEFIEYQYKTREEFENNANINGKLLKDILNEVSFAGFIFCE